MTREFWLRIFWIVVIVSFCWTIHEWYVDESQPDNLKMVSK